MALLVLSREEIETLSLISGLRINSVSVLKGIEGFNKENLIKNKSLHKEITRNFIKDGVVWKDKDGKVHLNRELQSVFSIINSPKKTIRIKSSSGRVFSENYYSMKKNFGVLFSIGQDEEYYTITYMLNKYSFSTWFFDEIIGDLGNNERIEKSIDTKLNRDEFNLMNLLIIINNHKKMLDKGNEIKIDEIFDGRAAEYMNSNSLFQISSDNIMSSIKEENLESVLKSLSLKKLVDLRDDTLVLEKTLGSMFIVPNLRDSIEITEISPFMRGKKLYASNTGYLIMEALTSKPMEWKLSIQGLKVKPVDFANGLLEFSDIVFTDTMRKELKELLKK
jgi:hypothetical protein